MCRWRKVLRSFPLRGMKQIDYSPLVSVISGGIESKEKRGESPEVVRLGTMPVTVSEQDSPRPCGCTLYRTGPQRYYRRYEHRG